MLKSQGWARIGLLTMVFLVLEIMLYMGKSPHSIREDLLVPVWTNATGEEILIHHENTQPVLVTWNDVQNYRKMKIKKACAQKLSPNHTYQCGNRQFILDSPHNALFCFVPKVGCTTWKSTLLSISKIGTKVTGSSVHNPKAFRSRGMEMLHFIDNKEADRKATRKALRRFLFVRHPIERLISAYRDKFGGKGNRFHLIFGRQIVKLYRKKPTPAALAGGHDVTFPEFVQYVVDGYSNPHWSSYAEACCICDLNYDFIGKFETFTTDSVHVLNEVFNKTFKQAERLFPSLNVNSQGRTNGSYIDTYIRQLTSKQKSDLNAFYKWDFQMFEYQPLSL